MSAFCREMRAIIDAVRGSRSAAEVIARASHAAGVTFNDNSLRKRLAAHRDCCSAPTIGEVYGSRFTPPERRTGYTGAPVVDYDEDERDTLPGMRAPTPLPEYQPRQAAPPPAPAPPSPNGEPDRSWIDDDPEGDFHPIVEPESNWQSRRVLLVPDSHWPFVSRRAWRAMMIAAVRIVRPDTVVILGDLGDFYSVSQHDKDPRRVSRLQDELDSMRLALDELDSLGARRKVYCSGNHEHRQARLIAKACPQLDGLVQSWTEYLGLARRGWEFVPYKRIGRVGNLLVTHEIGIGGVHATKRTLDLVAGVGGTDVAFGHTHRLSKSYLGSLRGHMSTATSCGWLGSHKSADYVHALTAFSAYQHGFGVATADDQGHLITELAVIYGDRAHVLGETVRIAA